MKFNKMYNDMYYTLEEFAANVYWALHHDPTPLSTELRYTLSWEAATERFVKNTKYAACRM